MKRILTALFLSLAIAFPASAGMIPTDAQEERSRVKALLERPGLAAELEKMGIAPQEAAARVDAMSEAEVRALAGRLDTLAAGGQVSDRTLLLIVLIILLAIIVL